MKTGRIYIPKMNTCFECFAIFVSPMCPCKIYQIFYLKLVVLYSSHYHHTYIYIYNPIEYNCSTMLNIICTTRHWFIIYSRKLTQIPVTYLKRPEPRPTVYRRSHGEHSFFELFEIQSPVLATMVPGHAPRYVQYWMNWGPIWSPKKEMFFMIERRNLSYGKPPQKREKRSSIFVTAYH